MIKFVKTLAGVVLLLLSVPAFAQIVTGQTMYAQRSGYWDSFLLVLPGSVNTRAATGSVDGSAITLALDFTPPGCQPIMEFLLPVGVAAPKDNVRNDVLVTARTDSGTRTNFQAVSMVTMGDTTALVYVPNSTNLMGQIGEMSRGQVLRVKVLFGTNESTAIYDTYSMVGLTAAYRRAQTMCANPASMRR
jgi:hypothetical protein